jgi:proline iminopeptidase
MRLATCFLLIFFWLCSCKPSGDNSTEGKVTVDAYFNYGDSGIGAGGVRMIPIETPVGKFKVWTKRIGNNPRVKILLLHGGPAATHEYMECFESFFPKEGFELYEYDQLGSYYSDKPSDTSLWVLPRFVEEVEQVRKALGLDNSNFFLLGNSWGGILAMEYALKYQSNLKGLIICNMMSSCPEYGKYADEVLAKQMDPDVLKEVKELEAKGKFSDPRYMELLIPNFYQQHICRLQEWPEAVNRSFGHINNVIYTMMQGPSEFGIAGNLAQWDIRDRLKEIMVPTLTVGAKYDTMDPEHMKWMSTQVKNGQYLYCPNGSHLAMWDDQQVFMKGVVDFIRKVDGQKG